MNLAQVKRIWLIPALLGVLTAFGLLSALLGTGYWYWIAWAALATPVIVIVLKVAKAK